MSHVYEKLHISAVFRNLSDILIKKTLHFKTISDLSIYSGLSATDREEK